MNIRGLLAWTVLAGLVGLEANPADGAAPDILVQDRIATLDFFKKNYRPVFEKAEYGHLERFHEELAKLPPSQARLGAELIEELDAVLPSKVLMPLVYWRTVKPRPDKVADVLAFHGVNRLVVLRDVIDDPLRGSGDQKKEVLSYFRGLLGDSQAEPSRFFTQNYPAIDSSCRQIAAQQDQKAFIGAIKASRLMAENFIVQFPFMADFSNGWLGFIAGNHIELLSQNDRSMQRIQWLNERVIFAGGTLDWSAPYLRMTGPDAHPIFTNDAIFRRIREMVDSARDSIFIDIFLFGGTLGATLAQHVIDQSLAKAAVNPGFRTLILHDFATNYNMKDEMMPVFEYIRDRIRNEPPVSRVVSLLQSNIQRHTPGMPFGITNIIPKEDVIFERLEKRPSYYESKIDHSKVMVVDANTDHPQAYFGSKNWTDHSGGYYYDNTLYVVGPAAALVQAAYVDDVDAALTTDNEERKWFYYQNQGFGNDSYLDRREEILAWMRIKRLHYPAAGNQIVRLAEANVDGTIKDVRNMLVEMIRSAEQHIYMEQLFIYDKYVIDALIKRKIQKPALDVRIIADHNGNFLMGGFPNTIFVRELVRSGIQVRARRTLGVTARFPNGKVQTYHQEDHRKISSVDGITMMVGSSNLNPDTLQGSFREFGAQIFDQAEIAKFEREFLEDWADEQAMQDYGIEQYQMTLGGQKLTPKTSALINDIGALLIRAKDGLEGRY